MSAGTNDMWRKLRREVPTAYCPECCVLAYPDDAACPRCDAARPAEGWPESEASPLVWLGERLDGRYIITRFLGSGSYGEVYEAMMLRAPRRMAIKFCDVRGVPKEQVRTHIGRLRREAETMGAIEHPNIVSLFEVLEPRKGIFALVMEYASGQTLSDMLRDENLEAHEIHTIAEQLLRGLVAVHDEGILHRDLKPDNICVRRLPDGTLHAEIFDFGVAHVMGESRLTHQLGSVGTPLYASPEQLKDSHESDERSDLYALGATLFQAYTGEPPFDADNVYEAYELKRDEKFPSLAQAATGKGFPPWLETLIGSLMLADPEHRPASAREVLKTFRAHAPSAMGTYTSATSSPDSSARDDASDDARDTGQTPRMQWVRHAHETPMPTHDQDHTKEDEEDVLMREWR